MLTVIHVQYIWTAVTMLTFMVPVLTVLYYVQHNYIACNYVDHYQLTPTTLTYILFTILTVTILMDFDMSPTLLIVSMSTHISPTMFTVIVYVT